MAGLSVNIDLYGLVFYTIVVGKFLFGSDVIKVFRKGIDPSGLVCPVMNWIWGSMELFDVLQGLFSIFYFWITKVSSTYLLHILKGMGPWL